MKKLIKIFFALCVPFCASAKEDRPNKTHYIINVGVDYQLNGGDVLNGRIKAMSTPNVLGYRIGGEFRKYGTRNLFMATGLDLKLVPQKISTQFNTTQLGYTNNIAYDDDLKFTNLYTDAFIRLGYAVPLRPKNNSVDIAFGMRINIPVNGKRVYDDLQYAEADGDGYNDLVMYRMYGFGHQEPEGPGGFNLPINFLFNWQIGYHFSSIFKSGCKGLNIGIDFSSKVSGKKDNRVIADYLDASREKVSTSIFKDNMLSIGMFAGIDL